MYKPEFFKDSEMRLTKGTPEEVRSNALNIAEKVMDPLRRAIKKPIIINSWYRTPEYNEVVGGVKGSQHTKGGAVDFVVKGLSTEETFALIVRLGLPFDQLIHEERNDGAKWIHISLKRTGTNRREKLKATKPGGKKWDYVPIK